VVRWGGLPTIAWHAISTAAPLLHVTTHLPDFLFAELELPGMLTVCTNTTEPMSQYDTNQSQIRLSQAVRKIRELIHIIAYIYIYLFFTWDWRKGSGEAMYMQMCKEKVF
jgi:hypothetical protein